MGEIRHEVLVWQGKHSAVLQLVGIEMIQPLVQWLLSQGFTRVRVEQIEARDRRVVHEQAR